MLLTLKMGTCFRKMKVMPFNLKNGHLSLDNEHQAFETLKNGHLSLEIEHHAINPENGHFLLENEQHATEFLKMVTLNWKMNIILSTLTMGTCHWKKDTKHLKLYKMGTCH